MAVTRSNPVGIAAVPTLEAPQLKVQVKELLERITAVDDGNMVWLDKQLRNIRFRYGDRKKRRLPWRGASNVSVPLIDGIIRRWRPGIASLVLDANPIASFISQEATDFDPARTVESFFTFLFQEHMDATKEVVRLVDVLAERGHAYALEGWDYSTEMQARLVRTAELFPQGIEKTVEAANEVAAQKGAPQEQADVIIARMLMAEYGLSADNPNEVAQVRQAANGLLEGNEYVRLAYRRIVKDRPSWKALDPINCITPPDQDPEDSDFFTIVHRMGPESVRRLFNDGHFNAEAAQVVIADLARPESTRIDGQTDSTRQQVWDLLNDKAGIDVAKKEKQVGPGVIYQIFCRLDLDGDGFTERAQMWYHPKTETVLALQPYVMPFDKWPITLYQIDAGAARPLEARGMPELLLAFQKVINAIYNMRQDAGQIVLAPVLAMRAMGPNYQKSVKWHPGSIIPVQNPQTDIKPLVMDLRILGELLREQQQTQTLAESYIGVFDASLTNLARSTERRTATEVQAIQNLSANIFGLDAKLFQVSMGRSFTKIWSLYEEFGPEELFFRVQGQDKPKLATKSELSQNYDIRAAGTPANTQKSTQINNIIQALQIAVQDPTQSVNIGELIRRYMMLIDPELARVTILSPEQRENQQTIMRAAALAGQTSGGAPPDVARAF